MLPFGLHVRDVTVPGQPLQVEVDLHLIPWLRSAIKISIGLIEILIDHDPLILQKVGLESLVSCMHTLITKPQNYQQFIDLLKYSLEYMHARSLKQVLPLPPSDYYWMCQGVNVGPVKLSPPLLFEGAMRRFIRNRLVSLSDKTQHLFWSFAQAKRCADVVDRSFIFKSLEKHRRAMDKRSEGVEPLFKEQIKEKFVQIIKNLNFSEFNSVHEYSSSACWEASSASGGGKLHLLNDFVSKGYTSNDELLKMSYHPRSGVSERRGFITMSLHDMVYECPLDICSAVVYPICEPLKIRNITKGNALPYAIAKGFQIDLHTHMRKMYQFDLIGRPLDITDIEGLVSRCPIGIFASGDFSAATDNVKIELTKLFFELCLSYLEFSVPNVSAEYIHILQNVLYEHMIHYKPVEKGGEQLPSVLQRNGQLMGSVLSFPVLCAINLAVYWCSVEPDTKNIKDLNVKINGDDILFRTTEEKYNLWLSNVPKAGLLPSPGKNFFHPKYCTVNSEMFSVHDNTVRPIPFFNVGMLMGQSKVARSGEKNKPVHCIHTDALAGSYDKVRANKRFLFYNKEKLRLSSTTPDGVSLNYYLPRELGGLGMKVPGMTYLTAKTYQRAKITKHLSLLEPYTIVNGAQRKIAKHLLDRWTVPYLKRPCQPIGFEKDIGEENNFSDIPNDDYHVLWDRMCPRLAYMRDKVTPFQPPNWKISPLSSEERELLKFQFKGIRLYRGSKLTVSNSEFVNRDFVEYRVAGWESG
jgi:hypothetical protein